jgi:tRNA(fMet)-specific endonuclease VapC
MDPKQFVLGERYRAEKRAGGNFAISTIVLFELLYGVANSAQPEKNRRAVDNFLSGDFTFVTFERRDAEMAGEIRAHLKSLGSPIGPYDLLIAAQALRLGATLVTANTREFIRVPDLTLDDWSNLPLRA